MIISQVHITLETQMLQQQQQQQQHND